MTDVIKKGFYSDKRSYRSSWKAKLNKKEKQYQTHPLPKDFPQRVSSGPSPWRTFYRQNDAFTFARSISEEVHVFSYESDMFTGGSGQRLYLATTYKMFWHYYRQLKPELRHHYEVIPEGAVAKLYFDLEFSKPHNPESEGTKMVEIFTQHVCNHLKDSYNITCNPTNIITLDASTEKKFSQHLIFLLPGAAFRNNVEAGYFVQHVCDSIWDVPECQNQPQATQQPENNSSRTVAAINTAPGSDGASFDSSEPVCQGEESSHSQHKGTENSNPQLFVEENGEELNKKAKRARLDPGVMENKTPQTLSCDSKSPSAMDNSKDSEKSQVHITKDVYTKGPKGSHGNTAGSHSKEDLKALVVKDKDWKQTLFCDQGVYTKNRNFRLIHSCKLGKVNPLTVSSNNKYTPHTLQSGTTQDEQLFLDSLIANVKYTDKLRILTWDKPEGETANSKGICTSGKGSDEKTEGGYHCSPYPEIDAFVRSKVNQGGVQGTIRRWTYFCQGELLIYDICKNRWCHNIGRPHKSNNIMIIADLKKGVYFQKCHDPACRAVNYKSPDQPLPKEVLPVSFFEDNMDDNLDECLSDGELLLALDEAESSLLEDGEDCHHQVKGHVTSKEPQEGELWASSSEYVDDAELLHATLLSEETMTGE